MDARVPTLRTSTLPSAAGQRYDTPRRHAEPLPVGTARATLSVVSGLDAGRIVPLEGTSMVVGRGMDVDLVIDDAAVSRAHARFVARPDGTFQVEDLGSTNGTFVRSRRIAMATLSSGDHVQLGPRALLRFALTDAADEKLQVDLYESAIRDPLTKAFNRRYLLGRLAAEVAHARRHRAPLSALMLDVDHFKQFNDRYGHFVGDRILCFVAAHIQKMLRAEDLLTRYGGDEFVVLCRETDAIEAAMLAERLRAAVSRLPLSAGGVPLTITVSIGVGSLAEVSGEDVGVDLVELIDQRLCGAKTEGRNRVRGFGT